jgi:hypothetical protein
MKCSLESRRSQQETMEPLRGLVRDSLRRAMDEGVIEAMDPDTLMRFLLDGFHGAVVPLFHQAGRDRQRVLSGLVLIGCPPPCRVRVGHVRTDRVGRFGQRRAVGAVTGARADSGASG